MIFYTIPVGRVFDIPIKIDAGIVIPIYLIANMFTSILLPQDSDGLHEPIEYLFGGLFITFSIFLSVLLHELGHSLVARRFGLETESIILFMLGGVANIKVNDMKTPKSLFEMAFFGPIVSLAIAIVCFLLLFLIPSNLLIYKCVLAISAMNVIIAVFNMLPIHPLDGSRVLWSIIWKLTGNKFFSLKIVSVLGIMGGSLIIIDTLSSFIFNANIFFGNGMSILMGALIIAMSIIDFKESDKTPMG